MLLSLVYCLKEHWGRITGKARVQILPVLMLIITDMYRSGVGATSKL